MRGTLPSLPIAIVAAAFVLVSALRADASLILEICADNPFCREDVEVTDGAPGDFNLAPGIVDATAFGGPLSFLSQAQHAGGEW
jgi:hypothetical protein